MKSMRAIVIALALVGGFYFYTTHHNSAAPSILNGLGNPGKVETVEAVGGPSFDAEGVPKSPRPLIQDGVATGVVHDTRSAALAGGDARSTGHALAPGGAGVGPAPTNLVLVGGGAAGVDELAAPIERGIYVTRLWYVNTVHPKHTLLTGMTRDGTFLIEDGRIARPLRDASCWRSA